jgi:hypothetical protein
MFTTKLTLNLRSPTGGRAYGIPLKAATLLPEKDLSHWPRTGPVDVVASGQDSDDDNAEEKSASKSKGRSMSATLLLSKRSECVLHFSKHVVTQRVTSGRFSTRHDE